MEEQVALVCERGVSFALVAVRPSVMSGVRRERDEALRAWSDALGVPAVLVMRRPCGAPAFHGPEGLVRLLARLELERLCWRELPPRAA